MTQLINLNPQKKTWNIEKIVRKRKNPKNKKQEQFLIRWEGYEDSDNTWEPADYIRETVPGIVKIFEQSKAAGRRKNKTKAQQKKQVQTKKSALYQMSIDRISCGHFQNKQSKSEDLMGKAALTKYLHSLGIIY